MGDALRRFTLVRALQVAIVAVIVTAVLAAGSILSWLEAARAARWAALLVLVALALAYAFEQRPRRKPPPVYAVAAAFLALVFISAAWSGSPRLTGGRGVALSLLFVACGALSYATAGRPRAIERVLDGVLAGAAAVGVGGLLVLLLSHDRAIQIATTVSPARYQGLGGGPNTATMVLAVGLPLALYAALQARSLPARGTAAAIGLLLLGSIVASGSRGALVSGFAGLLVFALLASRRPRQRAVLAASVIAAFGLSVLAMRIPQPLPPGSTNPKSAFVAPDPSPSTFRPRPGYGDANTLLRLQDDIGHPGQGVADTRRRVRSLTGSSGRSEAWKGALRQVRERPLLGYGFGTEERVFVDRYVGFNSGVPENSYIGLLLQLGVLGTAGFLCLVGLLLARALRRLAVLDDRQRHLVAACAGGLVVGLVLACFQSFIYAVGNNATAAVWICAFLLVAAATTLDTAAGSPSPPGVLSRERERRAEPRLPESRRAK